MKPLPIGAQGAPAPHKKRLKWGRKARAERAPTYDPGLASATERQRAHVQAALDITKARLELYVNANLTAKEAIVLSYTLHVAAALQEQSVLERGIVLDGFILVDMNPAVRGVVKSLVKKQALKVADGRFIALTGRGYDALVYYAQKNLLDVKVQFTEKYLKEHAMTKPSLKNASKPLKLAVAKVEKPVVAPVPAPKPVEKPAAAKPAAKPTPKPAAQPVKKAEKPATDRTFKPELTVGEFMEKHAGHKVTLLTDVNPKHGKSATRFGHYKNGMTVEQAVEKGVLPADLRWDASPHHVWRNAKGEQVSGAYIKLTK